MIKAIIKSENFLMLPSEPATKEDRYLIEDLKDTLRFHSKSCVGMAANMIGVLKRVIIFENEKKEYVLMFNPILLSFQNEYETEEGCLSLKGSRKTKRYKKIKVEYYNEDFKKRIQTFTDFTAQIIQHEIDHCNGILI